jgi:hypothetical protein
MATTKSVKKSTIKRKSFAKKSTIKHKSSTKPIIVTKKFSVKELAMKHKKVLALLATAGLGGIAYKTNFGGLKDKLDANNKILFGENKILKIFLSMVNPDHHK